MPEKNIYFIQPGYSFGGSNGLKGADTIERRTHVTLGGAVGDPHDLSAAFVGLALYATHSQASKRSATTGKFVAAE